MRTAASGSALTSPLQVAVFGAGAFGQNHIRVYRQLEQEGFPVRLAAIVDPAFADPAHPIHADRGVAVRLYTTAEAARLYTTAEAARLYTTAEAALADPGLRLEAASICTPTAAHAATAAAALAAGLHVLVEKPITRTLAEADGLIALAARQQRVLQAGHLERFNPAVQAFLPHLNRPMFFEAHRLSIFTARSLDVDVVLDLMVHDLDIVLTFAQSPVREIRAVGLPILSPRTDIANVRVEFASGCVANFTASRVSTERVRKLRFFQPHQYVSLDYARQEILLIEVDGPAAMARMQDGAMDAGAAAPGLKMSKPAVAKGEPLRLEIEAFLSSIQSGGRPVVSGEDGRAALALALDINQAIAAHMDAANLRA